MRSLGICVLAIVAAGHAARSQSTLALAVRVHVTDSSGAPVAGADVSIVHDLTMVLARGTTNDRGDQTLMIPHEPGEKDLVVRKIGFGRIDRFFADAPASVLAIRLVRVAQSLSAVKVIPHDTSSLTVVLTPRTSSSPRGAGVRGW